MQARPITSLDRWTEEELLHELDCAIMADDELLSFGNTGEVIHSFKQNLYDYKIFV